ncbi:MAG: N-acetyltransferase [Bacteroidetes bacterium]|nr:MAG: N-acetyltransferase [Bacteroidota bacterium]
MPLVLRTETPSDHTAVAHVIREAFANEPHSDNTEHLLVERLRRMKTLIPEFSIVAEVHEAVVGHILLTKIHIRGEEGIFETLALAPVSVALEYQNKGIGGALIREAHNRARALGFGSVVLIGHEHYYPRFGYKRASIWGIRFPFEAPDENCMAVELIPGALEGVKGEVVYPPAFFG